MYWHALASSDDHMIISSWWLTADLWFGALLVLLLVSVWHQSLCLCMLMLVSAPADACSDPLDHMQVPDACFNFLSHLFV
jgi:hypothetical protein